MQVNEDLWNLMQQHLGYDDDEMAAFRANPDNEAILAKIPEIINKTIVFTVIESRGCNSQHRVGDKFFFDGAGNLLTRKSPKRVCIYALHSLAAAIFASNELIYAGVDPMQMRLKHAGCSDVGVTCGGWGHIAMEFSIEEREQ